MAQVPNLPQHCASSKRQASLLTEFVLTDDASDVSESDLQDQTEFLDEEGRITIFPDGSRIGPSFAPWLAKAGAGVYFGPNHVKNRALPLGGPMQTSPRAEALAMLLAIKAEKHRSSIRVGLPICA